MGPCDHKDVCRDGIVTDDGVGASAEEGGDSDCGGFGDGDGVSRERLWHPDNTASLPT